MIYRNIGIGWNKMADRLVSVSLVTNLLAHYRLPCFLKLFDILGDRVSFFFLTKEMFHRGYVFSEKQPSIPALWLKGWRWHMPPIDDRHLNDIRPLLGRKSDIIIMGGWDEPTYLLIWLLSKITHKKLFFWIESTAYESSRTGIKELYKRLLLKHAAGCIVPGKRSFEYCYQLGMEKNRIFLAPNASDQEYFRNKAQELVPLRQMVREELGITGTVVLFVGRLVEKHKKVSTLIKACGNLVRKINNIHLIIVGDGPDKTKYEALVKENDISEVHFLGTLNHDQLCRIYAASDILVLPSQWEPWGFVLNEGMEFGLPLIVSNVVGAGPDLVHEGENGFVFPAGDIEALTRIIEHLIKDESLRQGMGVASRKIVANYSPENWARGVIEAINSVS